MWSAEIGSRDVIAIGQWHHPVCMCVWCRCNTHRPASLSLSLSLLASVSLLYLQIVATHKIWGFPRCFTWHCAQPEHTARTNGMPAAGRLEKRSRGKKRKKERGKKRNHLTASWGVRAKSFEKERQQGKENRKKARDREQDPMSWYIVSPIISFTEMELLVSSSQSAGGTENARTSLKKSPLFGKTQKKRGKSRFWT